MTSKGVNPLKLIQNFMCMCMLHGGKIMIKNLWLRV